MRLRGGFRLLVTARGDLHALSVTDFAADCRADQKARVRMHLLGNLDALTGVVGLVGHGDEGTANDLGRHNASPFVWSTDYP